MSYKPYLSIVVTGRNDDYGGDFSDRLQKSVIWWSYFLEKYKIHAEYVFVNWNPLPDKPELLDTISWRVNEYFDVRYVEVPHDIHVKFDDESIRKNNQLYEFIAKNSGVRRAKGEYILCTNADILLDPKIFEFIAEGQLKVDSFYRADRYDFYKTDGKVVGPEEELESIRGNVFEIKGFGSSFPFHYTGNIEDSVKKFKERNSRFLKWNLIKRKYSWLFAHLGFSVVFDNAEYYIHTSAAGDFLLMHKSQWQQLRGYSEDFYVTLHNDAELAFNAYATGLNMHVMFYPVYHQHHERRYSGVNRELEQDAYKVYKQLQQKAQRLLLSREPEISNDENWGLVNFDLTVKEP